MDTLPRLLFFLSLLIVTAGSRDEKNSEDQVAEVPTVPEKMLLKNPTNEKHFDVIQLSARTFGKSISDGNIWMVEFYSPNCHHCVEFAPIYQDVAHHYHSNTDKEVKIAKVNGNLERALTSRFSIYGYPSFFLIDGWSVYQYNEARNKKTMMKFIDGGYRKTDPITFYSSPMGPMGQMQGMLISAGYILADLFSLAQTTFGLSPLIVAMIAFGSIFFGCFVFIVFLALAIPPKQKQY